MLEEENKAALFRLAKDEVATAMHIADEAEKISKNVSTLLHSPRTTLTKVDKRTTQAHGGDDFCD